MADDVPHHGGYSGMKGEPVADKNLLLREPEAHLSHGASEVDSRFTRRYGSTTTKEWDMDLPDGVWQVIDEAGFGLFCMGLSHLEASRTLLGALVERWWDTTNSFHFSTIGDMTMTTYDFSMLTGLEVRGRPIPYDSDLGEWEAAWTYLLEAHPPIFQSGILWVYAYFPVLAPMPEVETPLKVPYSHRYDDHMVALCDDARGCQILVCRSLGHLSVSAPSFGWPDLPTEQTGWRYSGEPYQIPIEFPLPSHGYVRTPDSPPPSTGYVKVLLEVFASFEDMILRRETMLSSHGIQ
ncbi:Protein MAIN-LIKE 2, partial [Camellia lanceoleosa]